jgi:hypothetical protein
MKEEINMNAANDPQKILAVFKEVFTEQGYPYTEESDGKFISIYSHFILDNPNNPKVILEAAVDLQCYAVQIVLRHFEMIPTDKIAQIMGLIATLNGWSILGHLYIDPTDDRVCFIAGILIKDIGFDRKEFEMIFAGVMGVGHEFINLIAKHLATGGDPSILIKKLYSKFCR